MGLVFDLLLLCLLGYSVYMGYRRGFLVSASGIIAIIIASVLTGMFELGILGFIILNILLSVTVAFLARIIRKLKIPVVRGVDTALGFGFGFVEGALKVIILALIAYFITLLSSAEFFDGSVVIDFIRDGGIYDFVRSFIVKAI